CRVGPPLRQLPAEAGSRGAGRVLGQSLLMRHLRAVESRLAVDITRLMTGSIADLLEQYFTSDALRGLLSVSGVIGMWAGPRSPGTGYVALHHHIGEAGGQTGAWGFPRGGMGAVTRALAAAARGFRAQIRTPTPPPAITN